MGAAASTNQADITDKLKQQFVVNVQADANLSPEEQFEKIKAYFDSLVNTPAAETTEAVVPSEATEAVVPSDASSAPVEETIAAPTEAEAPAATETNEQTVAVEAESS